MTAPADPIAGRRALGYRVFGGAFDYLLHLRPAEWPIMAGHTALGYLLATGMSGAPAPATLGPGLLGLLLWVVALNGGTLAINSAFDRDEGDVAYLRRPPPPPRHLFAVGLGLMLLGWLAALRLPAPFALLYGTCVLMSVLYSVPPMRLKAVAGADWVINLVGFGALTPLAGWATTGRPVPAWGLAVVLAFGALFAALYPLTQLYQLEEDRRRGDRTLASVLGVRRCLAAALACTLLAFAGFGWALATRGGAADPLRWAGLAVALGGWLAVLLPWWSAGAGWPPARHQRGMHRALAAWAVTDVAILVALAR